MKLSTLLLFCFVCSTGLKAQGDWVVKKVGEGIIVYSKETAGSPFKSIRVTCTIDCELSSIVGVWRDVELYNTWVYGCETSKMLKKISENEGVYFSRSSAPWPVSDRELVMHNITKQDKTTKIVTSESNAQPGYVESDADVVRLFNAKSKWILRPIGPNSTEVSYEITVDPAGQIPAWLANLTMDQGPYNTMVALRKRVVLPQYQGMKFPHIMNFGR